MRKSLAIVILCCALALVMGLAACGGSSSGSAANGSASDASVLSAASSADAETQAKAAYDKAVALFDEGKFYSAKAAFEESQYKDWEQRAAACLQPMPETGELFHDEALVSDRMGLTFTVESGQENAGMLISVYTKDNRLASKVFIKGANSAETWLPGGEYYVKDASGTEWYGDDEQFGPDGHYESMVFDEAEGNRYLTVLDEGYEWTITINASSGGGQGVGSEDTSWENRA